MSSEQDIESTILLQTNEEAASVFGEQDANLRLLEGKTGVEVFARGNEVRLRGTPQRVKHAQRLLAELTKLARQGHAIEVQEVEFAARAVVEEAKPSGGSLFEVILISDRGKPVRPRTEMQQRYVAAMPTHDLVFAIGPA